MNNGPYSPKRLSGGKVAAAVIMPLLILLVLAATYVKMKRDRGKEERKRWSEAVDQRMSTISTDWKPISVVGAQAAIRNSITADASNRSSSFSFGHIRPVSTVLPGQSNGTAQFRTSATTSQILAECVSRVSFAPDMCPSSESYLGTSRAYHTAIVPPLPDRKWEVTQSFTPNSEEDESLSPTQANGLLTLSVEDIQVHLAGEETTFRPSVDAFMPALQCMSYPPIFSVL